jgi:hypothetical protein
MRGIHGQMRALPTQQNAGKKAVPGLGWLGYEKNTLRKIRDRGADLRCDAGFGCLSENSTARE